VRLDGPLQVLPVQQGQIQGLPKPVETLAQRPAQLLGLAQQLHSQPLVGIQQEAAVPYVLLTGQSQLKQFRLP